MHIYDLHLYAMQEPTDQSEYHLLDLVQAHDIGPSVIELRRPGTLMRRHLLRLLQIPAVGQIDRNPGSPECVAPDFGLNPGVSRPPADHVEDILSVKRP